MTEWVRIPVAITAEQDRRSLIGILTAYGLSVRIIKVKKSVRGVPQKFIEYSMQNEIETE